jgi:two-component system, cell cycle response regulator
MSARVLVVDDVSANVKLLEARLTSEYFEVLTASSGPEALRVLQDQCVDVVLLDVMMPGMDGLEVCRRIKGSKKTAHLPVVIVTALDQYADKVQGLAAGADDFLTKPIDDMALITRVRNLVRLKTLSDELMLRCATGAELAGADVPLDWLGAVAGGRILLVEDHGPSAKRIVAALEGVHEVAVDSGPAGALSRLAQIPFDVLIVSLSLRDADGLRLCGQVRSLERSRHLPIIMLVGQDEGARLMRGLDMGVNDYVMRPIDRHELLARVRTQIKRKRHADGLRERLDESVGLSVRDALTGLYNRRYLERHLLRLLEQAKSTGRPLSVLLADIDHFKTINDTRGHAAGDEVLRQFAGLLRANSRASDLTCRLGGEEFLVVMPETTLEVARRIGERMRLLIASQPFSAGTQTLNVTASLGLAEAGHPAEGPEALLARADGALYAAKRCGRNRVAVDAACDQC